MKRYAWVVALSTLGSLAAVPAPAGAQVWKKVKSGVSERVGARKQKADSTVVRTATQAVDSTLAPGSRAVESGTEKVGTATDAALDRAKAVKARQQQQQQQSQADSAARGPAANDARIVITRAH